MNGPRTAYSLDIQQRVEALFDHRDSRDHDEALVNGAHSSWRCIPIAEVIDAIEAADNAARAAAPPVERYAQPFGRDADVDGMPDHVSPEPTPGLRELLAEWLEHGAECGYASDIAFDGECNCGLVAALAASPAPEPTGLDEAWAEAEAACESVAPGAGGPAVRRWAYNVPDPYRVVFRNHDVYGPTPAAALRALAARLGEKP